MIKLLYCVCLLGLSTLTVSLAQITGVPTTSHDASATTTATSKKITTTVLNTTTINVVPFFFFPKNSSHVNDTSFTFLINANTTITESSPRGFIVDLLREIVKRPVYNNESFAFNVHVVKDNKYGSRINDTTCCFDGMMGELGRGEAQLAAAPLTVTMDRETYVDFTSPFLKWEALAVHRRRMTSVFRPAPANVEELLASDSTKWAVRKDGPLHMHLQQSRDEHDIRFRDRISHFPDTNDEGMEWVRSSFDHVFLLEEVAAQWALTRQCNRDGAVFVGFRTGIFERHYAFALPHVSHNRDKLNLIIHELYNDGTLAELHKTWWWKSRCSRASSSASVLSPLVISALALTALLAWR